jgi:hypothetical protein
VTDAFERKKEGEWLRQARDGAGQPITPPKKEESK